jgi:tRNA-Thr(GGU) m(6)t(6)A37 methyltransferase TsaA
VSRLELAVGRSVGPAAPRGHRRGTQGDDVLHAGEGECRRQAQGRESDPEAWLDIDPNLSTALDSLHVGDEIIVITWLHLAARETQTNDLSRLCGVFATRSPDRPNPLGLHRVTVRAIDGTGLHVGPLEAIDGTPFVDLKIALSYSNCDDRDRRDKAMRCEARPLE